MQITGTGPTATVGSVEATALPVAVALPGLSTRPAVGRFALEPQFIEYPAAEVLGSPATDEVRQPEETPFAAAEPLGAGPRTWTRLAALLPAVMEGVAKVKTPAEGPVLRNDLGQISRPTVSDAGLTVVAAELATEHPRVSVTSVPLVEVPPIGRPPAAPAVIPEPMPYSKDKPAGRSEGTAAVANKPGLPASPSGKTMPEPAGAVRPLLAADMQLHPPELEQQDLAGYRVPGTGPTEGEVIPPDDRPKLSARPNRALIGTAPAPSNRIDIRYHPSGVGAQRSGTAAADPVSPPASVRQWPDSRVPGREESDDRLVREAAQTKAPVETSPTIMRANKSPPATPAFEIFADRPAPAQDTVTQAKQVRTDAVPGAAAHSAGVHVETPRTSAVEWVTATAVQKFSRQEERAGAGRNLQAATAVRTDAPVSPPSAPLAAETSSALADLSIAAASDAPPNPADNGLDDLHAPAPGKSDLLARVGEADHRPAAVARGAVAQIAEAIRLPMDGSVEVRLSPEELGRVKLTMVPGEAGLVVQLVAERPETLELLRRHVDTLAADLRDLGYSGLEFSFSSENDGRRGEKDPQEETVGSLAGSSVPAEPAQLRHPRAMASDGRLDIRL